MLSFAIASSRSFNDSATHRVRRESEWASHRCALCWPSISECLWLFCIFPISAIFNDAFIVLFVSEYIVKWEKNIGEMIIFKCSKYAEASLSIIAWNRERSTAIDNRFCYSSPLYLNISFEIDFENCSSWLSAGSCFKLLCALSALSPQPKKHTTHIVELRVYPNHHTLPLCRRQIAFLLRKRGRERRVWSDLLLLIFSFLFDIVAIGSDFQIELKVECCLLLRGYRSSLFLNVN